MPQKKPAGPVLDGVPLQQLAPPLEPLQREDREQLRHGTLNDMPEELRPLVKQRREELMLDGIRLADLGATEVDVSEEIDLAVFYALQLTPERLGAVDVDWLPAQEEVQEFFTLRRPRAVILGRGVGRTLDAVRLILDVTHVIDGDWMSFECVAANGGAGGCLLYTSDAADE